MKPEMLKKMAAEEAVRQVRSGMVLGLGTGSTTRFALEEIARKLKNGELENIVGIPSSIATAQLAQKLNIPLSSLDQHPMIDLTIDGADEVDPHLNLIKGGGGALLREKVLAQASQRVVIIVDESKLSPRLGTRFYVPVEVLPFAWRSEYLYLESLGAAVTRRETEEGTFFKTDQGNVILDCQFGPIDSPEMLAQKLCHRAGIMEHGLFIGLASEVIVAGEDGVRHLTR